MQGAGRLTTPILKALKDLVPLLLSSAVGITSLLVLVSGFAVNPKLEYDTPTTGEPGSLSVHRITASRFRGCNTDTTLVLWLRYKICIRTPRIIPVHISTGGTSKSSLRSLEMRCDLPDTDRNANEHRRPPQSSAKPHPNCTLCFHRHPCLSHREEKKTPLAKSRHFRQIPFSAARSTKKNDRRHGSGRDTPALDGIQVWLD